MLALWTIFFRHTCWGKNQPSLCRTLQLHGTPRHCPGEISELRSPIVPLVGTGPAFYCQHCTRPLAFVFMHTQWPFIVVHIFSFHPALASHFVSTVRNGAQQDSGMSCAGCPSCFKRHLLWSRQNTTSMKHNSWMGSSHTRPSLRSLKTICGTSLSHCAGHASYCERRFFAGTPADVCTSCHKYKYRLQLKAVPSMTPLEGHPCLGGFSVPFVYHGSAWAVGKREQMFFSWKPFIQRTLLDR